MPPALSRRVLVLLLLAATGCGGGGPRAPVPRGGAPAAIVQAGSAGPDVLQVANGPLASTLPPLPLAVKLDDVFDPVVVHFKRPPKAGLLFDLDTGRVLWRREPLRRLPIASVTKVMTALLGARAGSKIGLLP